MKNCLAIGELDKAKVSKSLRRLFGYLDSLDLHKLQISPVLVRECLEDVKSGIDFAFTHFILVEVVAKDSVRDKFHLCLVVALNDFDLCSVV